MRPSGVPDCLTMPMPKAAKGITPATWVIIVLVNVVLWGGIITGINALI